MFDSFDYLALLQLPLLSHSFDLVENIYKIRTIIYRSSFITSNYAQVIVKGQQLRIILKLKV
jgi:hypothetical protein